MSWACILASFDFSGRRISKMRGLSGTLLTSRYMFCSSKLASVSDNLYKQHGVIRQDWLSYTFEYLRCFDLLGHVSWLVHSYLAASSLLRIWSLLQTKIIFSLIWQHHWVIDSICCFSSRSFSCERRWSHHWRGRIQIEEFLGLNLPSWEQLVVNTHVCAIKHLWWRLLVQISQL